MLQTLSTFHQILRALSHNVIISFELINGSFKLSMFIFFKNFIITLDNMAKGVHIENKVNMQKLDNTELMMRVESDIGESRAEMCVDLNGFQVILNIDKMCKVLIPVSILRDFSLTFVRLTKLLNLYSNVINKK